ncbi:MAG: hypothetical protein KKC05_02875, partial [Nanoarchaeota archaeon]|nr:hypothetical protein [Nanoarchaeota archaeon]
MAIQDILPILDIMPDLLRNLPVLVQILQAIGYVVFILFLGSISIRGYRGYANWFFRFGVRVGLGFVALIGGIALSNVVPFLNEGVYRMFQLNVLIFGVISSIILLVAVYMIAFNIINVEGMRKQIENLQKRLEKARDVKAKKLAPISIVGIVILIGFVLFSALFFGGFPDMLSDVGLNPDDLSNLADEIEGLTGQVEDVPQGCVSMVVLAQSLGP